MNTLIDIGANLAHESFAHDIEAVVARAREAGVETIIVTGSSRDSSVQALELARRHPGFLYATAGLHPHHASDWSTALAQQFRDLAQHAEVVSLGECGLDYFRDLSPRADQRRAFAAQLQLAVELKKPVFLHQREAHGDFAAILREHRASLAGAVVHCFTDTRAALDECLALDCYIGITGWVCDERRGAPLREVVSHIPDDRLLIETDAPYLVPHNAPRDRTRVSGRRNEPALLPYVVQTLAALRGQTVEHIAAISTHNARCLFRL